MGETAARVATEEEGLRCAGCEYDLRGHSADGTCPECGKTVAESIRYWARSWADPRWVGWVGRGMGVSLGVYLTILPAMAIGTLVGPAVGEALVSVLFGIMGLCAAAGGWWVSRPEPGRTGAGWLRVTLRGLSVLLGLAFAVTESVPWWVDPIRAGGSDPTLTVMTVLAVVAGAQGAALLWYGRRVAERARGRRSGRVDAAAAWAPAVAWWGLVLLWHAEVRAEWRFLAAVLMFVVPAMWLVTAAYEAALWWALRPREACTR